MLAESEKVVLSTARVHSVSDLKLPEKAIELAQLWLAHRKVDLELIKRQTQLKELQESSRNTPNQQEGDREGSIEEVQKRITNLQMQSVHAGMDCDCIKAQSALELKSKSIVIEKEWVKLEKKKLDLEEAAMHLRWATEEHSTRAKQTCTLTTSRSGP